MPTHDEMCATSSYDGDNDEERCGLMLTDTAELQIYRHILTVPSRSVNNAICECVRRLNGDEDDEGIKGASRWEFSLVAVEEMRQKKNETEQTAQKLVRGANAAVALTQLLGGQAAQAPSFSKGSGPLQSPSAGILPSGGGSTDFSKGPVANAGNAFGAIGQAMSLAGTLGSAMQRRRKA